MGGEGRGGEGRYTCTKTRPKSQLAPDFLVRVFDVGTSSTVCRHTSPGSCRPNVRMNGRKMDVLTFFFFF